MFRLVRIPLDSPLAPTYFYCIIVKLFLNLLMLVLASNVLSILFKKNFLVDVILSWLMANDIFFSVFGCFVILTDSFQKYFPPLWTIYKRLGFLKGATHINLLQLPYCYLCHFCAQHIYGGYISVLLFQERNIICILFTLT